MKLGLNSDIYKTKTLESEISEQETNMNKKNRERKSLKIINQDSLYNLITLHCKKQI